MVYLFNFGSSLIDERRCEESRRKRRRCVIDNFVVRYRRLI
jgi:hypothetical protein